VFGKKAHQYFVKTFTRRAHEVTTNSCSGSSVIHGADHGEYVGVRAAARDWNGIAAAPEHRALAVINSQHRRR
jgi:hypothetical protein